MFPDLFIVAYLYAFCHLKEVMMLLDYLELLAWTR